MTASGKIVLGKDAVAYIAPDITSEEGWDDVTFAPLGKLQGLNKTQGKDVAEIKERDINETTVLTGHFNREISLQLSRRPGNTQYERFAGAFEAGTPVPMAISSGPLTVPGHRGIMAEMEVTQFDDDQAHESTVIAVTLRPSGNYTLAPAAFLTEAPED